MPTPLQELLDEPTRALLATARRLGLHVPDLPWRDGLATAIAQHQQPQDEAQLGVGILEVHDEGFGFLRSPYTDYQPGAGDIYVSQSQIRRFRLRTGDAVIGRIRAPKEQERYPALLRVDLINGDPADVDVVPFEELAAEHPSTRLPLGRVPALAAVDAVAPLGLGARGLLIAPERGHHPGLLPPRTDLLRRIAAAFHEEDDIELWVLLVGERPEDVAEWREGAPYEVIATPFEEQPARHLHVAEITFERARRTAERGADVLILVDSFTRLLRFALADVERPGHAIDGVEADALHRMRRYLAAGRCLRDAGSVTVIGTVNDADPLSAALVRDLSEAATWQLSLTAAAPAGLHFPIDPSRSWT
ncbi:MAG TPA: hypothetical protein PKA64_10795, partial [Myxococcota bacterium]|nr:hypothetical protein [Myxococcota bacterium]